MAAFFELDEKETALVFDPADIDRGIVPLDLPDYVLNNAYMREALCKAKRNVSQMKYGRISLIE